MSSKLDLCVLKVPKLPRIKPAMPVRASELRGLKLAALGFDGRDSSRVMEIHNLTVLNEGLSDNRNQWAQFIGGLPHGFSGAPVLARTEGGWRVVGMVHIGGDDALTSRMIGADPMANFLANQGTSIHDTSIVRKPLPAHRNPREHENEELIDDVVIEESK